MAWDLNHRDSGPAPTRLEAQRFYGFFGGNCGYLIDDSDKPNVFGFHQEACVAQAFAKSIFHVCVSDKLWSSNQVL